MVGVWLYRGATSLLGALRAPLARIGRAGGAWRSGWAAPGPETELAAGSVWVHAASMGEVGAAGTWIDALLTHGYRPPVLLTTRTRSGLARATRDLSGRAVACIAPHDAPQAVGPFLDVAIPCRLDLIETEIWPNLILEARRRSIAVVFVSGTVTAATTRRLLLLGLAGETLLGRGVYALPQTETHAARFRALGVPPERIRVIGDLKAEPRLGADAPPAPFASRPALLFGSMRAGEEGVAVRLAGILERHRAGFGIERAAWASARGGEDPFSGRCRPLLVVAPRHPNGARRAASALARHGYQVSRRDEASRSRTDVKSWIEELSRRPGRRAGVLATHGELSSAYDTAWAALVGGTFAPRGGHNVWEAASRRCPALVGPYHENVLSGVEALVREGGGVVAADQGHLERVLQGWLTDQDLERRGIAAARAASGAAGASARALEALSDWELPP